MTDRQWTDTDLALILPHMHAPDLDDDTDRQERAAAVLDALTAAGWRPPAEPSAAMPALRAQVRADIAAAEVERLRKAERERDSLARRCAVRFEETETLRARVAELEQQLAATRRQLTAEADLIMRRPGHPPTAPDTAWWLRRLAECPICSGPSRETTGLVCQACGKDWAAPPETAGGEHA